MSFFLSAVSVFVWASAPQNPCAIKAPVEFLGYSKSGTQLLIKSERKYSFFEIRDGRMPRPSRSMELKAGEEWPSVEEALKSEGFQIRPPVLKVSRQGVDFIFEGDTLFTKIRKSTGMVDLGLRRDSESFLIQDGILESKNGTEIQDIFFDRGRGKLFGIARSCSGGAAWSLPINQIRQAQSRYQNRKKNEKKILELSNRAIEAVRNKDFRLAKEHYNSVIDLDPSAAEALVGLGQVMHLMGEGNKSGLLYNKAHLIYEFRDDLINDAFTLGIAGRIREAEAAFQDAEAQFNASGNTSPNPTLTAIREVGIKALQKAWIEPPESNRFINRP